MVTNVFADPEDQSLGTNRFKDYAFDGQYQYLEGDHSISLHVNWIHENQQWNTSFPQGLTSNPSDALKQLYVDLHYAYQRRYAGVLQYFATTGNADDLKYNTGAPVTGSANGSPNSKGCIAELDWLPFQNLRLGIRYTAYTQFNGAGSN